MGVFSFVKDKSQEYFDKRKEDKEFEEKLRREAEMNQKLIYEQEYKKAALKATLIKARRDAEKNTGLAKLRALNTIENLKQPHRPGALSRLSEYTHANIARREANLKRSQTIKSKMLEDRNRKLAMRINRSNLKSTYKPFNHNSFSNYSNNNTNRNDGGLQ